MSDAEELRECAERCRRLAVGVTTPGLAESLLALALDYLERAAKLEVAQVIQQQQQIQPKKEG
jgi:hypothetical protein